MNASQASSPTSTACRHRGRCRGNREIYATYLKHVGFDVEQAADTAEALARIARRTPDVIVMDLSMPNGGGSEATRRMRANRETKDVVVMVVIGHPTRDDVTHAEETGADYVLTKPLLPQVLPESHA